MLSLFESIEKPISDFDTLESIRGLHFRYTIWITVSKRKRGRETKIVSKGRKRITVCQYTVEWRNRATIVPMRVVVRIPPGYLVVVGNVLVPRRLGTRLNRTQPPIAITRETINVLEGGETPKRGAEGGGTTVFSLTPRCISHFFLLLFTAATFHRSFSLQSRPFNLSYIFDYRNFFVVPSHLATDFYIKKDPLIEREISSPCYLLFFLI